MTYTSFDAGDYYLRATPQRRTSKGLAPREGGKFQPQVYNSTESFSQALTPMEFEQRYGAPSESASFIDSVPVKGTGLRRDYSGKVRREEDSGSQDEGIFITGVANSS